jgi:hypothetical protein
MQYFYHTARGQAFLNKGDDKKLVRIGKFKTESEALHACKNHYEKACKALTNLNKPIPEAFFM